MVRNREQPLLDIGRAPLFLLSFRHRDELIDEVERAGWQAIAARRATHAERRFVASGAVIAVVDARGQFSEALLAVEALADPVEANGGALMVLIGKSDVARLRQIYAAGATHYLAAPFGKREFEQALRFAARHAARVGGDHGHDARPVLLDADESWWRWRPQSGEIEVSVALAARLPDGRRAPSDLLRLLDRSGRHAALQSLRRVRETGRASAFAHDAPGGRRIAQHLYADGSGAIIGRIEDLEVADTAQDPASRDPLTGLADRRAALRWTSDAVRACHDGTECVLLLLSISRFDMINSAHGRATGDALLRAVARRIERLVSGFASRRSMVARLAGAEFAVGLLGGGEDGEALLIAEQLVEAVSRPFVSGNTVVSFGCRIGGTRIEEEDRDGALVMRRASAALAEAKAGDSGVPCLLDASGHAATEVASRLEIDLRSALEKDEIEVLFQPQLSITTGAVVGVEALARWRHPTLGELGAGPLFAAADRSDYLVQLSAHIQRKALAIARDFPNTFRWLRLAINVTAADIAQPGFAEQFLALVDASGYDRKRVTVEVTESGLIEDLAGASALLAKLRSGGLQIAIDDFGTGYSSLAYLKALPVDYLKIDKQLAQDIGGTARDRVVVTGVIEMARSLGLSVVAEGVENEHQLALLAEAGCNIYQGFIFSPPVSADALAALMQKRSK